jgi:hypothetical protein
MTSHMRAIVAGSTVPRGSASATPHIPHISVLRPGVLRSSELRSRGESSPTYRRDSSMMGGRDRYWRYGKYRHPKLRR